MILTQTQMQAAVESGMAHILNPPPNFFYPHEKTADFLKANNIDAWAMEAGKTAMELGGPRSTNLAMVAFYSAFGYGPLNADDLRATVDFMSPGPFKETNLKIFDTCYETGKSMA